MDGAKRGDELQISNLKSQIDQNEQEILQVNSKNLALNGELDRKKDVEDLLEDSEKKLKLVTK